MPFEVVIKHTIDDQTLAFINRLLTDLIPKLRFVENIAQERHSLWAATVACGKLSDTVGRRQWRLFTQEK